MRWIFGNYKQIIEKQYHRWTQDIRRNKPKIIVITM